MDLPIRRSADSPPPSIDRAEIEVTFRDARAGHCAATFLAERLKQQPRETCRPRSPRHHPPLWVDSAAIHRAKQAAPHTAKALFPARKRPARFPYNSFTIHPASSWQVTTLCSPNRFRRTCIGTSACRHLRPVKCLDVLIHQFVTMLNIYLSQFPCQFVVWKV
jgi:hypothetical protein